MFGYDFELESFSINGIAHVGDFSQREDERTIEMVVKKRILFGCIALVMLVVAGYIGYRFSNKISFDFAERMKNEKIDDLTLSIFYTPDPGLLTTYPWKVENLTERNSHLVTKVVVNGSDLKEHLDLFYQINNDVLIPVRKSSVLDARMYYVLESKKSGKIFDVAMWTINGNMLFNGHEVKSHNIFYEVVIPFLPDDGVNYYKRLVQKVNATSYGVF